MSKNILVGVCGGISSYKTCELVRLLKKNKFSVKVVMTEAATKFVAPLAFQTLSENPAYTEMFIPAREGVEHISLAQWADLCVIAPLSANTLSKIAHGICDNLLATVICALPKKTKVVCAPAMNENMWNNPFIQENTKKLKKQKQYILMAPEKGELACDIYGAGRMPEAEVIFKKIKEAIKIGKKQRLFTKA